MWFSSRDTFREMRKKQNTEHDPFPKNVSYI